MSRQVGTVTDLNDMVEAFEFLQDWEQRYQYLVELGEQLELMPEEEMIEDNRVKPCMSTVYVYAYINPAEQDRVNFHGECDTVIIKGVLALLISLCSGKTREQIQVLDMDEVFTRLHLDEHLSPNRHVGVYAIVDLMKTQVAALPANSSHAA